MKVSAAFFIAGGALTATAQSTGKATASASDLACPTANGRNYTIASSKFRLDCNKDYYGGDMAKGLVWVASIEACMAQCGATDGCVVFAYVPGSGIRPCYLKNKLRTGVGSTTVWSGVKISGNLGSSTNATAPTTPVVSSTKPATSTAASNSTTKPASTTAATNSTKPASTTAPLNSAAHFSNTTSSVATKPTVVSEHGSCGIRNGQTCLGSLFGDCCSQWGYCGSREPWCGEGCDPKYGKCGLNATSPFLGSTKLTTTLTSTISSSTVTVMHTVVNDHDEDDEDDGMPSSTRPTPTTGASGNANASDKPSTPSGSVSPTVTVTITAGCSLSLPSTTAAPSTTVSPATQSDVTRVPAILAAMNFTLASNTSIPLSNLSSTPTPPTSSVAAASGTSPTSTAAAAFPTALGVLFPYPFKIQANYNGKKIGYLTLSTFSLTVTPDLAPATEFKYTNKGYLLAYPAAGGAPLFCTAAAASNSDQAGGAVIEMQPASAVLSKEGRMGEELVNWSLKSDRGLAAKSFSLGAEVLMVCEEGGKGVRIGKSVGRGCGAVKLEAVYHY
ncbi:hypothetical protein W97_01150 [Coniosporium apollinis CBS 100218]|uniref:Chitin-binding type-1 domain-containing protein n=1 Tax=Coniosporium apollinis (strain CBS 100218) TaxID=1168221 RepID=R7YJ26_CONA1|nr:uncharacterized protein W97_01150 [Coniosporium apollinis CBS 100218]EON61932.1 hypothetical protein W97_01150 [Coniosporium apollinis CBS 100218]